MGPIESKRLSLSEMQVSFLNLAQTNSRMVEARAEELREQAEVMAKQTASVADQAGAMLAKSKQVLTDAAAALAGDLGIELGPDSEIHIVTDNSGAVIGAELVTRKVKGSMPKKSGNQAKQRASAPRLELPEGVDPADALRGNL